MKHFRSSRDCGICMPFHCSSHPHGRPRDIGSCRLWTPFGSHSRRGDPSGVVTRSESNHVSEFILARCRSQFENGLAGVINEISFAVTLFLVVIPALGQVQQIPLDDKRVQDRLEMTDYRTQHIYNGLLSYADDHHHRLPPAAHWEDDILPYLRKTYKSWDGGAEVPAPPGGAPHRLAFNTALSGKRIDTAPDYEPLLFEVISTARNAHGNPSHLPPTQLNGGVEWCICYTNGVVNQIE